MLFDVLVAQGKIKAKESLSATMARSTGLKRKPSSQQPDDMEIAGDKSGEVAGDKPTNATDIAGDKASSMDVEGDNDVVEIAGDKTKLEVHVDGGHVNGGHVGGEGPPMFARRTMEPVVIEDD